MLSYSPTIDLGRFGDYSLSIQRTLGLPASLVAACADPALCRCYCPRILGGAMMTSNVAIREAYNRAMQQGYAGLVGLLPPSSAAL